jgi:nucleoside-diphosphate-sugar epimerase
VEEIRRVLVTGYAGYIGSVMVKILEDEGYDITGMDNDYFAGCDFGAARYPFPVIRKDVRDVVAADLSGFDAVIHLAALSNDPMGELDRELTLEINYRASVRLARLARTAGVARFLFSSSCSMYGAGRDGLLDERAPLRPLTAYAESKVRTEQEVSQLACPGFSPVFLRNATAYGASPRLRADLVLNNLACWAFTTGKIRIMSDGTPWRPLVHVEDIARAFTAVLRAPVAAIHNQAFNVGVNGENYQVRDLAECIRGALPDCEVEYAAKGGPDARNYRVDFGKIRAQLPEFKPKWDAHRGASHLIEGFRRHGITADDFQGARFTRLARLRALLDSDLLDSSLRWRSSYEAQAANL